MPSLSIDIEARYAKFQDAMSRIEASAKKSAGSIQQSFSSVNSTLSGLGVGVSTAGLVAIVKNAIDAADHLNDLSKKTGVAVDVLGGIGFAATQAGGDLNTVATAVGKLNKTIAEAGSGNKEAVAAFEALGISVEAGAGKLKTADKVLVEIANRFQNFEDGPEKAALALKYFSKAGADMIPLLNDGGEALLRNIEYFQKYSGVTQDIAEKSDAFNDTLEKIHLLSGAAGNQIAAELLPTLQLLAERLLEVKESSGGFSSVGKAINTVVESIAVLGTNVSYTFKQVGNEIGGIAAQLGALGRLDFKAFSRIAEEMREDAKAARDAVDKQTAEILDPRKGQQQPGSIPSEIQDPLTPPKATAPRLPAAGTDPAIAKLAVQLRELERMNDRERELLAERNEFLQDAYQKDLISIGDYYAARKGASDEALAAQQENIAKEIKLLQGRKAKDAAEQAQNEAKIKELIEKKAELQEKAGTDAIRRIQDQAVAYGQLQRSIEEVNTSLLEQQGRAGEASARRFDEQNRQLRQKLEAELATAQQKKDGPAATVATKALNNLSSLRDIIVAQGKLNDLQELGGRLQSDLSIATERAQIAAQTGAQSELESLRQVSDARAQTALDLKAVADAYADMAAKTGNPAIIQRAKEFQVEVEALAASADLVREKFEGVFESGFESFFEKLTSGTASVKDAFRAMFSSISSELTRMAAQDLGKQLFGKNGGFGGAVDFVSQLFGGKSAAPTASSAVADTVAKATSAGTEATSAAAASAALTSLSTVTATVDASMVALSTTTIAVDTSLVTLAGSASAAAAALTAAAAAAASKASSDGASGLLDLFSSFSSTAANGNIYDLGNLVPFAKGGIPGVVDKPTMFAMSGGRAGLMGEAGPEAIMPLHRDKQGELAVKMIGNRGESMMLPLARDASGKLSVRAPDGVIHAFANGAVFRSGSISPTFRTNAAGALDGVISSQSGGWMSAAESHESTVIQNINVSVPPGTLRENADQVAARTAIAIARSNRRNN
jgi:hypothetical protein